MSITEHQFEDWLKSYGAAWEAKNGEAYSALFEDDALYYWTPFEDPKKGRREIKEAFARAGAGQQEIDFGARILYVQAQLGVAHWSCAFTRKEIGARVHIDGICVVQFAEGGKALSFREWWHCDEDE